MLLHHCRQDYHIGPANAQGVRGGEAGTKKAGLSAGFFVACKPP